MVALEPKFRERTEKRCSCVTRPIKGGEGWGAGYRSRGRILVRRLHAAEEQLERLAGVGGFESILGNHWRFVVESARGSCAGAEHAPCLTRHPVQRRVHKTIYLLPQIGMKKQKVKKDRMWPKCYLSSLHLVLGPTSGYCVGAVCVAVGDEGGLVEMEI